MRKKLLCMLLASTMLCAAGTTVYAAEQPAAQAQAEVTDASGDEADAAVAEEAEILETEEDLDGASSTTAGQGNHRSVFDQYEREYGKSRGCDHHHL